jgi:hypothetical protein
MRVFLIIAAMGLMLASVPYASAFTIDPSSGTNPDGSSRYVDPDDQIHSMLFGGSGGESQHLGLDATSDRTAAAAKALITNQGVLAPDLFFSTTPRRR